MLAAAAQRSMHGRTCRGGQRGHRPIHGPCLRVHRGKA
jgi:hypothetical protein